MELLLWGWVTPADMAERAGAGARLPLAPARRWFGWRRTAKPAPLAWKWCRGSKTSAALLCGFVVLAHRWIVGRTFGWFINTLRLISANSTTADFRNCSPALRA